MSCSMSECVLGMLQLECRYGVFRNGENQKIGNAKQIGQRSRRERNWSTVENVTDPIPIPCLLIEGGRIQSERITKQDIE